MKCEFAPVVQHSRALLMALLIGLGFANFGVCATDPTVSTMVAGGQTDQRAAERQRMVERQIRARGITDPRVLAAMQAVPRHRFIPAFLQDHAYADSPQPIGYEQTISQPYIVAYMTEALDLSDDARVLEIGTGSGYQAAVLSEIAREVYTIEIVSELATRSADLLEAMGYDNIITRDGDGYQGWPEAALFDGIIVTAAPDHIPPALVEQLAVGSRLVIPVGDFYQEMLIVTKTTTGTTIEETIPVRFVPMTGAAREPY